MAGSGIQPSVWWLAKRLECPVGLLDNPHANQDPDGNPNPDRYADSKAHSYPNVDRNRHPNLDTNIDTHR